VVQALTRRNMNIQPQGGLDRYAALHEQTYGDTVDAATLIF
jgi:hypothetical protein